MLKDSKFTRLFSVILMLAIISATIVPMASAANYKISFKNSNIEITSPSANGTSHDGSLTITGKATISTVYLALRGPQGEMTVYPSQVANGEFNSAINLRFGEGTYTVWAGSDPSKFDGSIRFELKNTGEINTQFITASAYVDSENILIKNKVAEIIKPGMTDMEKLAAIHSWVSTNMSYDYELYKSGENILRPASTTLTTLTGICRDYSFLFAAMARSAGIETKVVYGNATTANWGTALHAWNESFVDGQWISIDTTWDSGVIRNGAFVSVPTTNYFNPAKIEFAKTHTPTIYTTH